MTGWRRAGRVIESLALDDGTGDWFDYNGRTTRVRDRLGRETVYVSNARQDLTAVHDAGRQCHSQRLRRRRPPGRQHRRAGPQQQHARSTIRATSR